MINFFKKLADNRFLGYSVFYGWNVLFFFTVLTLEFAEGVFSDLVHAVITSYTPVSYLVYTLIIFSIPVISVIIALRRYKTPRMLLRWFYGFEVPAIFLAMFRIFGFQELTLSIALWLGLMSVATFGYALQLLWREKMPALINQCLALIQMVVGFMQALFLVLYAIPLAWLFLSTIPEWEFAEIFEAGLLVFIIGLFFLVSGTLFIASPLAFIGLYFVENLARLLKPVRLKNLSWPGLALGLIIMAAVFYPWPQPQHKSFSLYAEWSNGQLADADLLEQKETLRDGLVNAYLWKYRYLAPTEQDFSIMKELYDEAFGIEEPWAEELHNWLISPFMYEGNWQDQDIAALAYEHVFDQAMERAEREDIVDAMSANFRPRQVEAGILSINQRQVKVTDRNLQSREIEPGVVELEFHERYLNETYQLQEVFYYFTLPAHCVITGLWLSDEDAKPKKYPYQIAPRGAAQKTYQQIRARRADPALLEQVGPYQYRLRIFPIPARVYHNRRLDDERKEEEARPMHITMRLMSLSNGEVVPVPKLTEKRNVFWEDGLAGCAEEEWFPQVKETYPAFRETTADKGLLRVKREMIPVKNEGNKFLVLLDGSYSMQQQKEAFRQFWDKFPYREQSRLFVLNGSKMTEQKGPQPWPENMVGTNDALMALKTLSNKYPQSRILWLSDRGNYELLANDSVRERFVPQSPIDVIHLNGYAPIYEDAFAESIMASGGGFYASGQDWLNWAGREYHPELLQWREADELMVFKDSINFSELGSSAPLWASRYTMAKNREIKQGNERAALDSLHQLAMTYSFVSPFSSFLCLVNERQKELLEENTNADDRFDRVVENGKMAGAEGLLNAHAVPEPHEWVLLFFGLGLLVILYRRRLVLRTKQ